MQQLRIELNRNEVHSLLEVIAIGVEMNRPGLEYHLNQVFKKVVASARACEVQSGIQEWPEIDEKTLAKMSYPIKKVTLSFYDTNPKVKP